MQLSEGVFPAPSRVINGDHFHPISPPRQYTHAAQFPPKYNNTQKTRLPGGWRMV